MIESIGRPNRFFFFFTPTGQIGCPHRFLAFVFSADFSRQLVELAVVRIADRIVDRIAGLPDPPTQTINYSRATLSLAVFATGL